MRWVERWKTHGHKAVKHGHRALVVIGGLAVLAGLAVLYVGFHGASVCNAANLYAWSFKKCVYDKSAVCVVTPDYLVRYHHATSDLANYSCPVWPSPYPKAEDDDE